jgi:DnaJ-class molecular chaperone
LKNPYEALGVARDADADTIRKAYRKLARQLHPDVNPGDTAAEERFKEVSHAYAVLSDDEKRRAYDEFGDVALESGFDPEAARRQKREFEQRFGAGMHGAPGVGDDINFGDIDDLLSGFFGGGRGTRGGARELRLRGADLEAHLEVEFGEGVRGCERRVTLGPSASPTTIRIPPGVADGDRLRVAGRGAPGIGGGPPGDLWVQIRVRPHRIFRREGRDLHLEVPISVREAILGAQVEIPTLDGRATVTVPPGSSSGRLLRLRGKGIPGRDGGAAGDLLARLEIRVPESVDDVTRAALEKLDAIEAPDLRKELLR